MISSASFGKFLKRLSNNYLTINKSTYKTNFFPVSK
jgi:hypothetical protein